MPGNSSEFRYSTSYWLLKFSFGDASTATLSELRKSGYTTAGSVGVSTVLATPLPTSKIDAVKSVSSAFSLMFSVSMNTVHDGQSKHSLMLLNLLFDVKRLFLLISWRMVRSGKCMQHPQTNISMRDSKVSKDRPLHKTVGVVVTL